jgi:hypothetical protein
VLVGDHKQSWQALADVRSPIGLFRRLRRSNRPAAVAAGLNQVVDVFVGEGRHMTTSMLQMWKPFVQLVRQDWGTGKTGSDPRL